MDLFEVVSSTFGMIGKIVKNGAKAVKEDTQKAREEAECLDVRVLCPKIEQSSNIFKISSYYSVLAEKCEGMDDRELIDLFEEQYDRGRYKVCNVISKIMENRGLVEKDENGKLIRNYN